MIFYLYRVVFNKMLAAVVLFASQTLAVGNVRHGWRICATDAGKKNVIGWLWQKWVKGTRTGRTLPRRRYNPARPPIPFEICGSAYNLLVRKWKSKGDQIEYRDYVRKEDSLSSSEPEDSSCHFFFGVSFSFFFLLALLFSACYTSTPSNWITNKPPRNGSAKHESLTSSSTWLRHATSATSLFTEHQAYQQ